MFTAPGERVRRPSTAILPTRFYVARRTLEARAGRSAGRSLPWHGRGLGFKSRPVHSNNSFLGSLE